MRRLLGLPLVLLFFALVPAPAGAATVCTVQVPGAVTASAPTTPVWPTFTGCAGVTQARWIFVDAGGTRRGGSIGITNGSSVGAWQFRDAYPTGVYKVVPVA